MQPISRSWVQAASALEQELVPRRALGPLWPLAAPCRLDLRPAGAGLEENQRGPWAESSWAGRWVCRGSGLYEGPSDTGSAWLWD